MSAALEPSFPECAASAQLCPHRGHHQLSQTEEEEELELVQRAVTQKGLGLFTV